MQPKVLVLDIETSPILAYVWGLRDQNISLNQIKEDWHIMCFTAKWLKQPGIIYRETRTNNDKAVIQALWKLLDEADIIVTQNGKAFDSPRIEARMMFHRMGPPSPYKHADTYIGTKKRGFTSHKLEYLTNILCDTYKKNIHGKFPGMTLWNECLKGNNQAWKEMRKYNKLDVLSTEELYLNTLPWAPQSQPSPNIPITAPEQCPYCKAYANRSLGIIKIAAGKYRRYICAQCGKSHKGVLYQ